MLTKSGRYSVYLCPLFRVIDDGYWHVGDRCDISSARGLAVNRPPVDVDWSAVSERSSVSASHRGGGADDRWWRWHVTQQHQHPCWSDVVEWRWLINCQCLHLHACATFRRFDCGELFSFRYRRMHIHRPIATQLVWNYYY